MQAECVSPSVLACRASMKINRQMPSSDDSGARKSAPSSRTGTSQDTTRAMSKSTISITEAGWTLDVDYSRGKLTLAPPPDSQISKKADLSLEDAPRELLTPATMMLGLTGRSTVSFKRQQDGSWQASTRALTGAEIANLGSLQVDARSFIATSSSHSSGAKGT